MMGPALVIAAATLTLILSSMFRRGPVVQPVVINDPTSLPVVIMPMPNGPGDSTAALPEISNPGESDAHSAYAVTGENPFLDAARTPLSGFAFNTGSASYGAVQREIEARRLPDKNTVRIEQLINHFTYDDAPPPTGQAFAARIEVAACPWTPEHRLVRIGLKAGQSVEANSAVAKDLRISVEFNPARVAGYRLIGHDRHASMRGTPSDAAKPDAIEPGQSVTALYEVIPAGDPVPPVQTLKYQTPPQLTAAARGNEMLTVELHYADPTAPAKLQSFAAVDPGAAARPSTDFNFAAAVAEFGLILRDSPHKGTATYDTVLTLAQSALCPDAPGERGRFIELVRQTRGL